MRAPLIAAALACAAGLAAGAAPAARAAPPAAGAATPLALAERQVVTLEFDRPVARVAVTDPDLLAIRTRGTRVEVGGARGGRASLEIAFEDGATVTYEVTVAPARRAAATAGAPGELDLRVGEERRIRAPGVARVLLEENGVARVRVDGDVVAIVGLSPGVTSLLVVDAAGARTTWSLRVR